MILGFLFAILSVTTLSVAASVAVEFRQKGGLGQDGSAASAVFALVLMWGLTIVFAVMTFMRFSGTL